MLRAGRKIVHRQVIRVFRTIASKANSGVDSTKVLVSLADLQAKHNISLKKFPMGNIVGQQSAGKTTFMKALIAAADIFPVGDGMATKKKFCITTIRSDKTYYKIGTRTVTDKNEARDLLAKLNDNSAVKQVDIIIYSPDVYNMMIKDHPGLIQYLSKDNKKMPEEIAKLTEEAIADKEGLLILVHGATQDIATDEAFRRIAEKDQEESTLGVITKPDLVQNDTVIRELLANKGDFALGHGWHVVCLGAGEGDKEKKEERFFADRPRLFNAGIAHVRERISAVQLKLLKDRLPSIVTDIDARIESLEKSNKFLGSVLNDPKKIIISKLQPVIESLVKSSPERRVFEHKVKERINECFALHVKAAIPSDPLFYNIVDSENQVHKSIIDFHMECPVNPANIEHDGFQNMMANNINSSVPLSQDVLAKVCKREMSMGCLTPVFDFVVEEDEVRREVMKTELHNSVKTYLRTLLREEMIQTEVLNIIITELLNHCRKNCDDLSANSNTGMEEFVENMLKTIGNELFEENIKYSIKATVGAQLIPSVDLNDVSRKLVQMNKSYFVFQGGFFANKFNPKKKLKVPMYGQMFNSAYIQAMATILGNDVDRLVHVNMTNNMVSGVLMKLVDYIETKNVQTQVNHNSDLVKDLKNIKVELTTYMNSK